MRRTVFVLFILLVAEGASFSSAEKYWVAFAGLPADSVHQAKYIMKIDSSGNILIPPHKVLGGLGGYMALGHNDPRYLNMWIIGTQQLRNGGYGVFRAVIEKRTLNLISLKRLQIDSYNDSNIFVTNKKKQDFLAVQVPTSTPRVSQYMGFGLSRTGALDGKRWLLLRGAAPYPADQFALSSDGRILVFPEYVNNPDPIPDTIRFWLQRLGQDGRPVGSPVALETRRGSYLLGVTNPVSSTKRYMLYYQSPAGPVVGGIFLQTVRVPALQKLGARIKLPIGDVIDPAGRFVLGLSIRVTFAVDFQELDKMGRPTGPFKLIARNLTGGISILKD